MNIRGRAVFPSSVVTPRSVGYSYLPSSTLARPVPPISTVGTAHSPLYPTQWKAPRANPVSVFGSGSQQPVNISGNPVYLAGSAPVGLSGEHIVMQLGGAGPATLSGNPVMIQSTGGPQTGFSGSGGTLGRPVGAPNRAAGVISGLFA